jgi:hypothetical protein
MQQPSLLNLNTQFDDPDWPELVDVRTPSEGSAIAFPCLAFDLIIGAEISCFSGHFPEQAVLPGVVQVHWAAKLGRLWTQANAEHSETIESSVQLKKVKFNTPVLPNYELCLELMYRAEKAQITFHYHNSEHTFSSGVINFPPRAAIYQPTS